jgi:hypothetical protein
MPKTIKYFSARFDTNKFIFYGCFMEIHTFIVDYIYILDQIKEKKAILRF